MLLFVVDGRFLLAEYDEGFVAARIRLISPSSKESNEPRTAWCLKIKGIKLISVM